MYKKMLAKCMCLICICLLQTKTYAQQTNYTATADTLKLDIKQAEKMFLDNNLQLLAQHYNIQSSQALVEQAKKWDNPILNTDQNVYANNHFFEHGTDAAGNPQGEVYVQVQQIIKTAGKRGKQIALARTGVNQAEWEFKATMRTLHLTLVTDFYTIAQLQGNATLYEDNMQRLTKLVSAMQAQYNTGDIAKKEYLRVQALTVSLQQDMVDNAKSLEDVQSEIKTLLRITGNTFIQPTVDEINVTQPDMAIVELIDTAKMYNTDYQQEVYELQYQKQNHSLQKALAVPDVTFGPEFDQAANYAPNYVGLAISLPLPVWDRNQGNIKSSKYQVKQEEANLQQADVKLQNDVMNAYKKLLFTLQLSSSSNKQFYKDYYQIYNNIVDAYDKRQISLLEFLDYFSDYENTREQELEQALNLRIAKENLNDVVGIDIIH